MDDDLIDIIEAFLVLDSNEAAVPILDDADAIKVLVAWSRTDNAWRRPRAKPPKVQPGSHGAAWAWAVAGWTIDVASIARIAGLQTRVVRDKVDMLVGLRLIYPDGRMAKSARTAINVYVGKKIGVKQPRNPRRSDKVDDDTPKN